MWSPQRNNKPGKKKQTTVTPQSQMIRRQIIIGVVLVILIGLLLTAVWYVTRLPSWQIKDVAVVGGVTIQHAEIEDAAVTELSGTYFRLIPKRFMPLYPEGTIAAVVNKHDRVKQVALTIDADDTLIIAFEEHIPSALWCGGVTEKDCLFVDQAGIAFANAPDLRGAAFVRYVTATEPRIDEAMIERSLLNDTTWFIEEAQATLGLFVTHVMVPDAQDVEFGVAGGGRIKLSQSIEIEESFDNFQTILTSEDFAHLEPGTFNYIDLRFGDKVFVNEVKEEVATSTATSTDTEVSSE